MNIHLFRFICLDHPIELLGDGITILLQLCTIDDFISINVLVTRILPLISS